jgi:hypothetical protein
MLHTAFLALDMLAMEVSYAVFNNGLLDCVGFIINLKIRLHLPLRHDGM